MKRKHAFIFAGVFCVLVVITGLGVYLWRQPNPREVVDNMKRRVVELESVDFDVGVKSDFYSDSLGLLLEGRANELNRVTFSGEFGLPKRDGEYEPLWLATNEWYVANESDPFLVMDLRQIGEVSYVRMREVDADLGGMSKMVFGSLKGKWLEYNPNRGLSGGMNKIIAEESGQDPLTGMLPNEQDMQALKDTFLQTHVLKVDNDIITETINGEEVYRVSFRLQKKGLQSFIEKLKTKNGDQDTGALSNLDAYKNIGGRMWIDSSTYEPERILLTMNVIPEEGGGSDPLSGETLGLRGETTIDIRLSDFDKPVEVEPPTETYLPEELFREILGSVEIGNSTEGESSTENSTNNDAQTQAENTTEEFLGISLPPIEKTNFSGPQKYSTGITKLTFHIPDGDMMITANYFKDQLSKHGWDTTQIYEYKNRDRVSVQGTRGSGNEEYRYRMDARKVEGAVVVTLKHTPPQQ